MGAHADLPNETMPLLLAQEAGRRGIALDERQLARFRRYYEELLAWNERVNLTRITDWKAVQVEHFLDSLTVTSVLPPGAGEPPYAIVDIGAGAGFPGLPLKVLWPHSHLTLIESVGKKAAFLEHLVEVLDLNNVTVLNARAEEAGQAAALRATYDLALARAVAGLATLLEYALPLLRLGGTFVAYKGQEVEEEIEAAGAALDVLGGRLAQVRPVSLPGLEGPRHLVVVGKVAPTPERYPRRPGRPAKRPLA